MSVPIGRDLVKSCGRQFPIVAFCDHQLGAIGKELRRTAFVGLYMGRLTANHRMVRLAKRSQGQGVCRGAIKGKEHLAIGLKQFSKGVSGSRSPRVVAIAGNVAVVGRFHRGPNLRTNAGIIVTGKLLYKIGALDIRHMFLF